MATARRDYLVCRARRAAAGTGVRGSPCCRGLSPAGSPRLVRRLVVLPRLLLQPLISPLLQEFQRGEIPLSVTVGHNSLLGSGPPVPGTAGPQDPCETQPAPQAGGT